MDSLLARQLRKHLPSIQADDPQWSGFFAAVENAYADLRRDQTFIEHTLATTSQELTEANEKIRRDAENQIASLSQYYQQTLELQQGMILCVRRTPEGFVHTLCRGELARRLGLVPDQVEGRTVEQVAAAANVAEINAAFARAWAGEELPFSFTHACTGIEVLMMLRPRRDHGEVCEIIASGIDISTLKKTERELIAAKDRAEAADRAKSEFLAVMSHEIRTPLNAVIGFCSLLVDSPLNATQQGWIRTISASGRSLATLIDDILDFSKIEAGHLELHPEPLSVSALLNDIESMFHQRAASKRLAIEMLIATNVPATIATDVHRLRQILVNLTGNAIKFTASGSIRVEVRMIEPPHGNEGALLRFAVTDTGVGIPPDRLERLFKPFSQVDSSTTRNYGGTGLGLAISHRLVRLLGGQIGVETKAGVGSTFHFTIRAPVVTARKPAEPASGPRLAAVRGTPHLRVLVAEDHPENRELIRDFLSSRGIEPDIVENGRLAVESAVRNAYDIIFMDLLMPDMDGLQATRKIRDHFGPSSPRIFALTANVFPEDRARCREAGMDGLLTKPLNFQEIIRVLNTTEATRRVA